MRATLLLVPGLALLLSSCAARTGPPAPPVPNKKELPGKWKNTSPGEFVEDYEFGDDGTFKVNFHGMAKPVTGKYSWSDDRTLDLEYDTPDDVQEAYRAAAKAEKELVHKRIKSGVMLPQAGPPLLASIRDELPAKDSVRVSINEKPPLLFVNREGVSTQTYEKEE